MSSLIPALFINKIIVWINIENDNILRIILGFFLTIILLYLAGFILSVIGKKFFNKIEERVFYNIPIFSTIYKTIKQVVESISNPGKNSFKKVVMVEFPRKGVWTMGFVTGESEGKDKKEYYHVIVPTTPNPTSAYLLFIPKKEVKETNMSIDEGVKTILSGGVIHPGKNNI